jgi:maleylpyruvate isomerase
MTDPLRDLAVLQAATERLLASAGALDNARAAEPSRLPGWSRNHVLAHLSRNADALVNVLEGRPMYPSTEARAADIERDARRPLDVQLADVRDSAARLHAVASLPGDRQRTVALRGGVTDRAARIPFRRLAEVELHHVDLGIGYGLEDLPDDFVRRETEFLADRFAGAPGVPPVLVAADGGGSLPTGGDEGGRITVGGPAAVLMGWLAGRVPPDDPRLRASGGTGVPPVLPAL